MVEKELTDDGELDIAVYARSFEEGDNITVTCDLLKAMEQAVDVFNEQKAEIERLKEMCSKSSYRDSWKNKFFKAQEEIERLTEENAILKENPPIIAGRSLGKTIRAKLLAFDKMKEQNAELQKQVDELLRDKGFLIAERTHIKEQAVKDTTKEIYQELNGHGTTYVKKWIKEHYGVEVE